ncbi:Anti-sigma K factor RskA [Sulfitobacter guttiformis KCTC 32187]|uniref:Anti-sigma-K factor RskA n=2 Tax=Sulfitobacter guttiformis TaxID=74349 RepID=A0A420DPJ6_9RHOB|nr:Anti-sigma K factor RskA [Sulfitobacter guttiformis KCTC 32187]RKE96108.1 anti-sigma-K factor RskA [Sulfitobacter guttiformis]
MIDELAPHGDDLLAAELVLKLLEGEELAYATTRLAVDPAFAALVMGWQERLVAMTDSIDPVAPPRRVKKKLLKQMFAGPPVPLSERLWVWKGLSFAAIALVAYMGIQQLGPEVPQADQTIYASQLSGQEVPLQVLAVFDPARGDISIGRVAGEEATGRVFELWAIVPDAAPVSLGVLPVTERARVVLPEALRARVAEITLAISDEPTGGSPTGAPTGAVLAAAPMVAL